MATDAFQQGKLAFEHNVPKSGCEYPTGSTLRTEWMEGWTQALNGRPSHDSPENRETAPGTRH
ncbi:Rmf/CrpP family protein [Aureimonas sp. AU12]|uniref:Rmf/CrpP family protein n=1 Tax=Aureimonas sp. AU12 TaxID=1638161 RepID=UPI000B123DD6|nr:Rmf/CrpP family protein [Aureimonas sp. AU12]